MKDLESELREAEGRDEATRARLTTLEKELSDLRKNHRRGIEKLEQRMNLLDKILKDMGKGVE